MRTFYISLAAGLLLAGAAHAATECSAQRAEGNASILTFPCAQPKFKEYAALHPDKALACSASYRSGSHEPVGYVCTVRRKLLPTP
ncbi:MAG TPA: hypothetical protein VHC20_07390 [Candidatus Paceibacterota bacterium]|nr:hypothetical protein [Candidatus Paceibacterota bacterium]